MIPVVVIPSPYHALASSPEALAANDETLLQLIRSIDVALSEAGDYAGMGELYVCARDLCAPILGRARTEGDEVADAAP